MPRLLVHSVTPSLLGVISAFNHPVSSLQVRASSPVTASAQGRIRMQSEWQRSWAQNQDENVILPYSISLVFYLKSTLTTDRKLIHHACYLWKKHCELIHKQLFSLLTQFFFSAYFSCNVREAHRCKRRIWCFLGKVKVILWILVKLLKRYSDQIHPCPVFDSISSKLTLPRSRSSLSPIWFHSSLWDLFFATKQLCI